MTPSKRRTAALTVAFVAAGTALVASPVTAIGGPTTASQVAPGSAMLPAPASYLVLAREGMSDKAVRAAITTAGGTVTAVNDTIGMYTVSSSRAGFTTSANTAPSLDGVVPARAKVAKAPDAPVAAPAPKVDPAEADLASVRKDAPVLTTATTAQLAKAGKAGAEAAEPLAPLQWDMDQIQAPQAHWAAAGTGKGVRVGIMDTGVDGTHPDIAPNFNAALSRNFTTDDPIVDGSCASDPDGSCADPADVDENGHGTHVASTIASPVNGVGIAGVAPDAEIVNLRTGQDSGYFFLAPTVNALTYAVDIGIDVVNMSYYIDPWLYNCASNPADSPAAQREQRTVVKATNRALTYARSHGVTLVAAAGNEHTNLNNPTADSSSPDYPGNTAYPRTIDNSCKSMPAEGNGVVTVSSTGPSKLKADYSNWGSEEITVAAPGGYSRDGFGTPNYQTPGNLILAAMPKSILGSYPIDPETGESQTSSVVSSCPDGKESCAYWRYIQGTSMASPHAAGVAALIVGKWGSKDAANPGLKLAVAQTAGILKRTATNTPCPAAVYTYPDRDASYAASCDGDQFFNSWYGEGIVNALTAVTTKGLG